MPFEQQHVHCTRMDVRETPPGSREGLLQGAMLGVLFHTDKYNVNRSAFFARDAAKVTSIACTQSCGRPSSS